MILKTKYGHDHVPPIASGTIFNDVSLNDFAADWIEQLANEGITLGCDANNFCPKQAVTQEGLNNLLSRAFP